jgi:class 3 adenylate cyclase
MGTDDEGTHERLKAHRHAVDPKVAEHHGRIVKTTGDGLLAEFPSVVDAVRCAVEVQRGMAERNAATPVDQRIEFRIGVNLGDVIAEEDDIFGDGVNIAARLEALADPGGIGISRVVRAALPVRGIGASRASRTSRGPCGSMCCARGPSLLCRYRACRPPPQSHSPQLRHACRSWCCRLPI